MTAVRKIPIADVELSVICSNRCRREFGLDVTLDVVAAKTDDELKAAGLRRRDIREIREAASHLVEASPSRPMTQADAVAIDRLRERLKSPGAFRLDDEQTLRSLITAYESQAERLRVAEKALGMIAGDRAPVRSASYKNTYRGGFDAASDLAAAIARSALTQSPPATENG